MSYCSGPVPQALGLPNGGRHSPWNKLSGVRFSCTIRMMCWKPEMGYWAHPEPENESSTSKSLKIFDFMLTPYILLSARWRKAGRERLCLTELTSDCTAGKIPIQEYCQNSD